MSSQPNAKPEFVRIPLTQDQKDAVRAATGVDADEVQLTAKELEERIAPMIRRFEY